MLVRLSVISSADKYVLLHAQMLTFAANSGGGHDGLRGVCLCWVRAGGATIGQ